MQIEIFTETILPWGLYPLPTSAAWYHLETTLFTYLEARGPDHL